MNAFIGWVKAKAALLMIGAVWGSLILFMLPLMVAAHFYDKAKGYPMYDRWLYSILIAQDILVNCILGGYFRTTISSELGNLKLKGSKTGTQVANIVDRGFLFFVGQKNHCIASIEPEDRHLFNTRTALAGFTIYSLTVAAFIAKGFLI